MLLKYVPIVNIEVTNAKFANVDTWKKILFFSDYTENLLHIIYNKIKALTSTIKTHVQKYVL